MAYYQPVWVSRIFSRGKIVPLRPPDEGINIASLLNPPRNPILIMFHDHTAALFIISIKLFPLKDDASLPSVSCSF